MGESSLKAESSSGTSSQKFGGDDEETGGVCLEFSNEQSTDMEVHDEVAGLFTLLFQKGIRFFQKVATTTTK